MMDELEGLYREMDNTLKHMENKNLDDDMMVMSTWITNHTARNPFSKYSRYKPQILMMVDKMKPTPSNN